MPLSALKELKIGSQKTESLLESLRPQLGELAQGLGRVEGELSAVRRLLETRPQAETQAVQPQLAAPEGPERPERADRGDQWETEAVVKRLEDTQRTLGERIRTNTLYNAVFTYTATAITISAVYLLTRGAG